MSKAENSTLTVASSKLAPSHSRMHDKQAIYTLNCYVLSGFS